MTSSTGLTLPEGVDKLSFAQKTVAIATLGIAGWFVIPILITLMVNVYMALALGIPLAFIAYNYQLVWHAFTTISWKLTQGFIGLNPIDQMERYLDWVQGKHKNIQSAKTNLVASRNGLDNDIKALEESHSLNLKKAKVADETGFKAQAELFAENALSDKETLKNISPMRDGMNTNVEYLNELDEVFGSNTEKLKHRIGNLRLQYKSIQENHKAMKSANDVVKDAGYQQKMFDESIKQTNEQMNRMTAQIQQYESNLKPMLEGAKFDRAVKSSEARQLLDSLRDTGKQLTK